MGTAVKHPVQDQVKSSVIFDIQTLWRWLSVKSVRMSKITNDGLTQSGTGCFIAVPGGLGGTTSSALDSWSEGCGFDSHYRSVFHSCQVNRLG